MTTFKPKILAFAGSTRVGSYNKKLIKIGIQILKDKGADVTELDLRDIPMPLYDGDLEEAEGIPDNAWRFRKLLVDHHGCLISSPEYNSSISGVLKNAIDWASRPVPEEPPLLCFKGKVMALMSASPGKLGGLRALVHVRSILGSIGVLVLPTQLAIPQANKAFNEDGTLRDEMQLDLVSGVTDKLVEITTKLFS